MHTTQSPVLSCTSPAVSNPRGLHSTQSFRGLGSGHLLLHYSLGYIYHLRGWSWVTAEFYLMGKGKRMWCKHCLWLKF